MDQPDTSPRTNTSSTCTELSKSGQRGASITHMASLTKVIPEKQQHVGMKQGLTRALTNPKSERCGKTPDVGVSLLQPRIEHQDTHLSNTACDPTTNQALIALESGAPLPGIAANLLFDPIFPSNSPIEPTRLTQVSPILAAMRQVRLEDRPNGREI